MQNWRSNTGAAQTLNLKFLACFPMCVGEVRYQAPQYHSLARFACCCCCRSLFFSLLSSSSFSLQPFSLVFDRGGKVFAKTMNVCSIELETKEKEKKTLIQRIFFFFQLKFIPFFWSVQVEATWVLRLIGRNWNKFEWGFSRSKSLCHYGEASRMDCISPATHVCTLMLRRSDS